MNIDYTEVYGFEAAIRGMRNPLNSWDKSDSLYFDNLFENNSIKHLEGIQIGKEDMHLAQRLIKSGTEHSKFLRFITVWADWELPLYVWKEADTYKFIEKNSCSTMHKITSRELNKDDFEWDIMTEKRKSNLLDLNKMIVDYKAANKIQKTVIFRLIVQDLSSAYLQKRTIMTNYAELRNIYKQRHNHKLEEWHKICNWIESLPYATELITYGL